MGASLRPPGRHQIRDLPNSAAASHSGRLGSESGSRSRNLDVAAGADLLRGGTQQAPSLSHRTDRVRPFFVAGGADGDEGCAEIICGKEIKAWTPLISHPHRGPSANAPITLISPRNLLGTAEKARGMLYNYRADGDETPHSAPPRPWAWPRAGMSGDAPRTKVLESMPPWLAQGGVN